MLSLKYNLFINFVPLVRNISGKRIKNIRFDNGREFVNRKVKDLLSKEGVTREHITPYTPEQNGLIERDNRTVQESARTMLIASGLPKILWPEAVRTAIYILNRSTNSKCIDRTPYEKWFNSKPELGHVRVFGTDCFVQVPKQLGRNKWDPKAKKVFLVGFEPTTKNFRLFDPDTNKVFISCNVRFNESRPIVVKDDDELNSLRVNETWEITERPKGVNIVGCKWAFKLKPGSNGNVFKARLVARGFSQREGVDFNETFAPVVRYDSIRTILSVAAIEDWEIMQFDVKTAFLNGDLYTTICMEVPKGVIVNNDNMVCRLKKSLYGLKQASRVWNEKFTEFLKDFNMVQSQSDGCVFRGEINGHKVILLLYVDDGLVLSSNVAADCRFAP